MKGKLIILVVVAVAVLVLFPSVPKQIVGFVSNHNPLNIQMPSGLQELASLLSSNSAGEITGHTRGDVEVVGNRVIMYDGPTTLFQNIAALAIIGFFVIVGLLAKGS